MIHIFQCESYWSGWFRFKIWFKCISLIRIYHSDLSEQFRFKNTIQTYQQESRFTAEGNSDLSVQWGIDLTVWLARFRWTKAIRICRGDSDSKPWLKHINAVRTDQCDWHLSLRCRTDLTVWLRSILIQIKPSDSDSSVWFRLNQKIQVYQDHRICCCTPDYHCI